MHLHRTLALPAVLASAALALAACGGGGGGGEATTSAGAESGSAAAGGGDLTPVSIGALPILPTAAFNVGIDNGIFEDHGLAVTLEMSQGGAAVVPAVVSGEVEFGTSNVISLLQARQQGIDVRIITHWSSGATEGDDVAAVLALPDSGIADITDLENRTVAVNTLNNIGEMTVRGALRAAGGDDTTINFVEMGFPDMPAALEGGQIDAAYTPEPFMTVIQDNGGQVVSYPHMEVIPGMPTQMFFTSAALIEDDPELVETMVEAMNEVLEYAEANPDEVRAAAVELLDMDPAIAERAALEHFGTDLREEQIQAIADLIVELDMIEGTPDVEGLMPPH